MRTMKIIKYVFSLIGLAMLIGALFLYRSTQHFVNIALHAEGTVVELVRSRSSDSDVYKPRVSFTTQTGSSADFISNSGSNPPSYSEGEKVDVLYDESNPTNAKINGFFSLWGGAVIVGSLGAIFFLIGAAIAFFPAMRRNKIEELKRLGIPVQTKLKGVEKNQSFSVNGQNPYVIITQWQNPATSKLHVFKSDNIWFDPTDYVNTEEITVFIERNNPKKYYVDTSFLPELAN